MLPREKLINYGVDMLEEEELIAIILGSGNRNDDVFTLSRKILDSVNKLSDLVDITYEELVAIKGIKCAKATKLIASLELAKRIFSYNARGIKLDGPKAIYENVKFDFLGKRQEQLLVLYLDKKMCLIKKKLLSLGSSDRLQIDKMEILRIAIKLSCVFVVMVHNHPSNTLSPSKADIETTKDFLEAAKAVGINLIDHLIITSNGYYSFLEEHII